MRIPEHQDDGFLASQQMVNAYHRQERHSPANPLAVVVAFEEDLEFGSVTDIGSVIDIVPFHSGDTFASVPSGRHWYWYWYC
jgi:hypothetical protein